MPPFEVVPGIDRIHLAVEVAELFLDFPGPKQPIAVVA